MTTAKKRSSTSTGTIISGKPDDPALGERKASDGPRSAGLRAVIVLLAVLAPQVLLYWPSLFGGMIALPVNLFYALAPEVTTPPGEINRVLGDPIFVYEPFRRFVAGELRAGRMPLWNPHIFCGAPLFTNSLSPFQWLYYVWPDPSVLAWMGLSKSLVAGIGAFLFFRRILRVGFWPAVFGAAIYPLSFFFVLWYYFMIGSACVWLPWLLLCTDAAVQRPSGWGPVGVALVTAAVLLEGLGAPWPHMLLASGLYALWRIYELYCWREWRSAKVVRVIVALGCAWTLGGILTAPQNLPAADYLRTLNRVTARAGGLVEQKAVGWRAWEEVLFPCHYGNMTTSSAYLRGEGNQLEGAPSAYAGLLTAMVLAPLAFCDPRRRRQNWFWIAFGIFGLAYQVNFPLVSEIFRVFPFTVIRNNRFTFYTGWAMVALAVNGVEAMLTTQRCWRPVFWWSVALLAAAGIHAFLCLETYPAEFIARKLVVQAEWYSRVYSWEVCLCVGAIIVWWGIRRRLIRGTFGTLTLCGLTLGELLINARGANPQCDRVYYYPETPITRALRAAPPGRVAMGMYLRPNVAMMYGLDEIRGYDGADPKRIVELYRAANPDWLAVTEYSLTHSYDPPRSPIMDMLGLRYVFHDPKVDESDRIVARDRLGWVEERDTALPRVWVPQRAEPVADDAQCLERLAAAEFDPRQIAWVSAPTRSNSETDAAGTAEVVEEHARRVVVRAHMQTGGLIILGDAWDAGWKAFVDGRETPVLRANFLLRGVELPAGEQTVEFRYEPASFKWGLWMFTVSAGALVLWSTAIYRKGRHPPDATAG